MYCMYVKYKAEQIIFHRNIQLNQFVGYIKHRLKTKSLIKQVSGISWNDFVNASLLIPRMPLENNNNNSSQVIYEMFHILNCGFEIK